MLCVSTPLRSELVTALVTHPWVVVLAALGLPFSRRRELEPEPNALLRCLVGSCGPKDFTVMCEGIIFAVLPFFLAPCSDVSRAGLFLDARIGDMGVAPEIFVMGWLTLRGEICDSVRRSLASWVWLPDT